MALALLIPLGTAVVLPESIQNSALAFAAGVLLVVLVRSLMLFAAAGREEVAVLTRRALAATTAAGAVLAGLTCLVI